MAYTWSFTVGAFSTNPCTTAGLTADRVSPQAVGTTINFAATSTGCSNPQYLFYLQPPGGAWTAVRTYGAATWSWNTSGYPPGNYLVDVWVRDSASGMAWEAYALVSFAIGNSCAINAVTPDKTSPQAVGTQVTFTAKSTNCGTPEYLFYLQPPGGAWTLARGYGVAAWTWNTSTIASVGTFLVDVWVRSAGSGVAWQAYSVVSFAVTNVPCTGLTVTPSPPSPQVHGVTVTFTAAAAGCGFPEYAFYLKGPGTSATWTLVRGYGGRAWSWSTAGVSTTGTYLVDVWVRAVGSGVSEQAYALVSYTLT